jgi:hypothetical protein
MKDFQNALAVVALGAVAIICTVGIVLNLPAKGTQVSSPKATAVTPTPSPPVTGGGNSGTKSVQPTTPVVVTTPAVATSSHSDALALLGTIGAAAVGGLAGMLTAARRSPGNGDGGPPGGKPASAAGPPGDKSAGV